jgi:competence protein ComEC
MSLGRHGHRAPLLWLLLPLIAGLSAGKLLGGAPWPLLAGAGLLILGAIAGAWSTRVVPRRLWPPALSLAVALAGIGYFHLRLVRLADWDELPPREARLTLRVTQVFATPEGGGRVNGLAVVTDAGTHLRDLVGQKLYFSLFLPGGAAPPLRSERIEVIGVLEVLPRRPPSGGFAAYLVNAGMNFKLTRGRLLREAAPPSPYQRFCRRAMERLHAVLGAGLDDHPALAAILRAMMLGQVQELSGDQKGLFMRSGTLHLFAISGQQISVIALCLQTLLHLLRVPRLPAALVGLTTLWLYVDITGASPSAVRAFLMCALVIAALTLRRPGNILSALAASALCVLMVDPMQLFSASFQMSYGIVAVLLLLGVPLAEALQARWPLFANLPEVSWRWHHRWRAAVWRWFLALLGIGLATMLVSMLTSVQYFRLFTPGALLANLILIPASSVVIGAGFASLLCGLPGFAAGSVLFNHAGALVLGLMDGFLRGATAMRGVFVPAHFRPEWLGPAGHAALLAACLAGSAWRWRRERGGFWPPFVLVALLLLFGAEYGP